MTHQLHKCSICGKSFPEELMLAVNFHGLNTCARCGFLSIAGCCSHAEQGDSIKEISDGEHYAALFVEAVNGNRIIDGGEDK